MIEGCALYKKSPSDDGPCYALCCNVFLVVELFLIFFQWDILRDKILSGDDIFPILPGFAVIISPSVHVGNLPFPVAVHMLDGGCPFERI